MAEINFGLIDTQSPARIANALMPSPEQQGAQALQVVQMQQAARQGQVSQMQFQKMKQDAEGVAEFSRRVASFGGPSDPMEIARAYLAHPDPEMKKLGAGLVQKAQAAALYDKRYPVAPPAAATPPVVTPPAATGSPTAGVNTLPALVGATPKPMDENQLLKQIQDEIIDLSPLADDPRAKQRLATLNEREKELLKTLTVAQGTTVFRPGLPPLTVPEATPTDVRTMRMLGYPETPQGYTDFRDAQRQDRLLTPAEQQQKIDIARASRPPATPATPAAPVAVAMPDGTVKYVSREEAIRTGMTPASAMEGLTPKERQKREAALPAATSAVNGFDTKAKSFIKDLIALRDDAGLDQITGPIYGRVGSVSRAGSRAQALYDKIVAKGGFQALQDLRDASKTGGALGNVSNQEGKQLTASFAAIDRRQAAPDVQAAINQAIADIEGARTRTREAYDSTYEYKQATKLPGAVSGATGKWGTAVAE
jgi:hypothetical protein